MVAQVEDRLVDAARVAARAGAHGGAVRGAAGRASRVGEGVRRRRPDHQHQQAREHGLGDAGRRDRRARAQRGFAQDARRRGLDAPWAGGAVDHVPGPDVARRAGRGGRDRVPGPDVLLAQRVGHPALQAPREPGQEGGRRLEERALRLRRGADAARRGNSRSSPASGRGTPGSAGRAREGDGAKAQQTPGFARQELPVASAGESPASDRKRRTGLVSGVSSPDAASELFSSKEEKSDERQSRPARDAGA